MNGLIPKDEFMDKQIDLLSDAYWEQVFEFLQFMMNDIYPADYKEYSKNDLIIDYFKNKYQIKIK